MQCRKLGWLGASIACMVLAFGFGAGCTPPEPGNDNTVDNVNENGSGQPVPTELDIDIEGQGGVEQESIGNNLIQLTAVAEEGWAFDGWFGSVNSIENPLTVSPDDDTNIGARFVESAPPPVDTDGDGVADADDDCPNTVAGADVDTNGCAANQLDSDNDGVANLDDICPETPTGATVNTDGCAPSELDTDTDGIADDIDACPETPDGVSVGADGCAPGEVDSDGDGVTDDLDDCPNTDEDVEVGDDGCPIPDGCDGATGDCFTAHATGGCGDAVCCSLVCDFEPICCTSGWDADCASIALDVCPNAPGGGGGGPIGGGSPVCGDGTVSAGEDCEPPNTDLCNASCRYICGNGFLQGNEQCDPPNGINCDSNCRIISDGPVSPQGDWLSTQYLLNGASGYLIYGPPETYRLNSNGSLVTAFVTTSTNQIETEVGGDATVLNSTISPGVLTDMFRIDDANGFTIFKTRIDQFTVTITPQGNTTWAFDYLVRQTSTVTGFGDLTADVRFQGTQQGTVGGEPSQIVWTSITGTYSFVLTAPDCGICEFFGLECVNNQCSESGELDNTFIQPGDWTRTGG